jgi:hypothetical protein
VSSITSEILKIMPRLTTHSTGLALSEPFIFLVDCSPVNSGVMVHLLMEAND